MLLTVISLSLFLAVGKRRSELTLVSRIKNAHIADVRKTLSPYSERLLDVYAPLFATSTFMFYSLFTFLENPQGFRLGISILLTDYLPNFFIKSGLDYNCSCSIRTYEIHPGYLRKKRRRKP